MSKYKKILRRYEKEADQVITFSEMVDKLPSTTIQFNFQHLRGRTDREAVLLALGIAVSLSEKTLKMRPYKVQIMGALALIDGHIAEMKTGEGKTLTAALASAWHALQGRVHLMTANNYLAKRDALSMHDFYKEMGLTVSYLTDDKDKYLKEISYQSNIVYGTASQFVFDYLRDQLVVDVNDRVQYPPTFLIIDEADSILIDEARTPFVLSGQGFTESEIWLVLNEIVKNLSYQIEAEDSRTQLQKLTINNLPESTDIIIDRKSMTAFFTEQGMDKVEDKVIEHGLVPERNLLWNPEYSHLWRAINATAKALFLYHRDKDYILKDDEVVIVDNETGRLSFGRRWSDGLHQAIEAKESVNVGPESLDLGKISLASYLLTYPLTSGMTGTALPVEAELASLYGKSVIPIPTHKPSQRIQHMDILFSSRQSKYEQIVRDVKVLNANGQPVLIGTGSVEESETLSALFTRNRIPHKTLNAKQNQDEALIIAQAGKPSAVTIATSMAGRGTDIMLGGNPELDNSISEEEARINKQKVLDAGGLFVIGAQRLDSRRLDLQLEGRSGRQGDPGASRFYVSTEDALIQEFGGNSISKIFTMLGINEPDGVEHRSIANSISGMQRKKQALQAQARNTGFKHDSTIDPPRSIIYRMREEILTTDPIDQMALVKGYIPAAVARMLESYCNNLEGFEESWDIDSMKNKLAQWGLSKEWFMRLMNEGIKKGNVPLLEKELSQWIMFDIECRSQQLLDEDPTGIRTLCLMAIDKSWQSVLEEVGAISKGIHLRSYANLKPDLVFKKEVFDLFSQMKAELPVIMLDYVYSGVVQAEYRMDAEKESEAS